jgi:hypothetical protein
LYRDFEFVSIYLVSEGSIFTPLIWGIFSISGMDPVLFTTIFLLNPSFY